MPRRTKEDAEKTRQHLLNTALRLFATRGVARTNLKDIAAEAELTHGALYWHFKNKQDLVTALYEECRLDLNELYLDQLQAARQNALESLGDFICEWALKVIQDERSSYIWRVFHQGVVNTPELESLVPKIKQEHAEWINLLSGLVKKAYKQDLISAKSSKKDMIAVSAVSVVMGIYASAEVLGGELVKIKPLARQMSTVFINGLQH